jgi:hypothetical protein
MSNPTLGREYLIENGDSVTMQYDAIRPVSVSRQQRRRMLNRQNNRQNSILDAGRTLRHGSMV